MINTAIDFFIEYWRIILLFHILGCASLSLYAIIDTIRNADRKTLWNFFGLEGDFDGSIKDQLLIGKIWIADTIIGLIVFPIYIIIYGVPLILFNLFIRPLLFFIDKINTKVTR